MVNATLANLTNATEQFIANKTATAVTVATPNWLLAFVITWLPTVAIRFWSLIAAPFRYPEMQWVILPVLITFVATESYFFRNIEEELSWNTALINSLILLYVAIDLTRTIFEHESPWSVVKLFWQALQTGQYLGSFSIIIFIGGLALILALVTFFHLLPSAVAYKLASHVPITFIAYFSVVLVYADKYGEPIPLDSAGVIAATLVCTVVLLAMYFIQRSPGLRAVQRIRGGS